MVPGDLCKHLLHNCLILINLSKFSYILPITWRGALHLGNSRRFRLPICSIPRRSLGGGAEVADPGAGAASGGRRWARGITEAIVSRRLSGATMKAAIWHRPLAATQEAIGVLTIGAVQ